MDLGDELGAQGFQWVFVVHLHGGPNHSRALDDTGDYFHATHGGRMIHLAGLLAVIGSLDGPKSAADRHADGLPIHAGMDETSLLRYLTPTLVRAGVVTAPNQADSTMDGLIRLARRPTWPGYFGAPVARPCCLTLRCCERKTVASESLCREITRSICVSFSVR